ncbi:MAG TPA: hypothetical protein VGQ00_01610 [Candidatus Norongarragalinales archaeon]|jgi:hypothetical protein|nr:hypothetical protein [Candidatus Norongarragalinales archaeon]
MLLLKLIGRKHAAKYSDKIARFLTTEKSRETFITFEEAIGISHTWDEMQVAAETLGEIGNKRHLTAIEKVKQSVPTRWEEMHSAYAEAITKIRERQAKT